MLGDCLLVTQQYFLPEPPRSHPQSKLGNTACPTVYLLRKQHMKNRQYGKIQPEYGSKQTEENARKGH
jgi:hypothetical protein